MTHWLVAQRLEHLVLELREMLVRLDENQAAAELLHAVGDVHLLHGNPRIMRAREDQYRMCAHLWDPETLRDYYAANPHEKPFEEQYPGATIENAHEVFPRLAFLRDRLPPQVDGPRILDLACNDGAFAANLALEGHTVDGIDLGEACIERARKRSPPPAGRFVCDDLYNAPRHFSIGAYDAVVAFEVIEHVPDPVRLLNVMCAMVKPGGSLFISTPNGVDHGGNLPDWDHVEPKGHVRAFTPATFARLLAAHGEIVAIEQGPDRVMVAEVSP